MNKYRLNYHWLMFLNAICIILTLFVSIEFYTINKSYLGTFFIFTVMYLVYKRAELGTSLIYELGNKKLIEYSYSDYFIVLDETAKDLGICYYSKNLYKDKKVLVLTKESIKWKKLKKELDSDLSKENKYLENILGGQ